MSPDLAYVISHGFAARMILHSTLLDQLKSRGLKVALISPDIRSPAIRDRAHDTGAELVQAPSLPSARTQLYGRLRPYLYEDVHANPALRAKHLRSLAQGGLHRRLEERARYALNRTLCRAPALRRPWSALESRLLASRPVDRLLDTLKPRMVVATYPVAPLEAALLQSATRKGIPTVGQLLSWDNITAKGRFAAPPDQYLAWGPIMAEELHEHYGVTPHNIHTVGVPHFDAHLPAPPPDVRASHLHALGLNPTKPYLFFGMSSPYFTPHEIDLVEWLAQRVRANTWTDDLQLVVRPHPQNVQGDMADEAWLPRLRALVGPRVGVDWPSLHPSELLWSMEPHDLARLASLIAGAAVTLNSGSTLAIDAIVQDRPVLLTGFDADQELPWWRSARRALEYIHLAKLISLGGVRVANSYESLTRQITAYLDDPSLDAEGRALSRERELHRCDGQASARAADVLHKMVEATKASG